MSGQNHFSGLKTFLGPALCVAALVACGGGGNDNNQPTGGGTPMPTSGETSSTSTAGAPIVEITGVSISSPPVVEFSVSNPDGSPMAGSATPSFTIAKLIPAANGDPSRWQSYINRTETAGSVGPGTENAIQATSESNGTLADHKDGTYTYTFATDITNVTSPLAVPYEPDLTHRIALYVGRASNAIYTWQPSTGGPPAVKRDIVKIQTCNSCHNQLGLHGGRRIDTKLCVNCHNPGSTDANSGNTVDFKVMIHKIHRGENLPSVEDGGKYVIYGFRNSTHDYSTVVFPQDIRNCTRCHDPADPDTPQAVNYLTPSIEACGSCHDDVDFSQGIAGGHPGGVVNNSECTFCHAENKIAGSVAQSHAIPEQVASANFQYNIISAAFNAGVVSVTFEVTNPTNGLHYNLLSDPEWTAGGGASRLAMIVGWDTTDYHHTDSGNTPAQPLSVNVLSAANVTANADGTYTATANLPGSAAGSGVAGLEGHPAAADPDTGLYTLRVPVKSVVKYFAITDAAPVARRQVVDIANCNQCHGVLSLHGGNRTDETRICVICHNPNATDLSRRPATLDTTPADGIFDDFTAVGADGKREESIDFKRMIHAIHAGDRDEHGFRETGIQVYGFSRNPVDFSHVRFPGILSDCATCHVDDTYELPLSAGVLGSTVQTGDPALAGDQGMIAAALADPSDDKNISPTAAMCSSCHDETLTRAHMQQNGGAFDTIQAFIDDGTVIETCSICHGPGGIADVSVVHMVNQ